MTERVNSPLPHSGVVVPLVTPLDPDRAPDLASFGRLIDAVLAAGVKGILVLGSSGESVALPAASRRAVAAFAAQHVDGRAHVLTGMPTHGTDDVLDEARAVVRDGTDALLVAAPSGVRLSNTELRDHFARLADAGAPVVAYEVPPRVGIALDVDLIRQLAADEVIVGLKDSSSDLVKARRYVDATRDIAGFVRFTGCEECIDAALLIGYDGAMPGLANVFPRFHVAITERAAAGEWETASRLQSAVVSLLDLYSAPLPGGGSHAAFFGSVKEALRQLGVIEHGAASAMFTAAGDELAAHVAGVLEQAARLESEHL
jgi:4-hydroxy-tetrahydrodipicolinate synthase